MVYYNKYYNTIVEGRKTLCTLKPVQIPEIVKIRLKKENYFFFKSDEHIYTAADFQNPKNITKLDSLTLYGKKHLCNSCDQHTFLSCPKVLDFQLPQSKAAKITKKRYIAAKRIEKYPFIECGFETLNKFCVFECSRYRCGCNLDDEDYDSFNLVDTTFSDD